ncbi:MerR family transcriptional regulator [Tepidibacter hydrothermalis]|uniref:MerR family transcriptional regulator n=1 Tax=Tepidibacter hydrothermalis TaxID=3036126 RepID=A0ABY8EFZ3_9FIRM|nr:MerR family transcriptional regulator [Tepidibacter hydrothermalis]WFD11871.1 MerR family transcriptional regulator [Tepidibacter hydrothermalis]
MITKFLISEAAKKYNISRATLIYYDNINLLNPSYNHENGYRYYTYKDLEKLELILTLKESGLHLSDIKSFLDRPSHEESIHLLNRQNYKINQKIQELKKLQIILEKRTSLLSEYEKIEFYNDIRLNYYPEISVCKVDLNYNSKNPYEDATNRLKETLDASITSYGSITSKYGLCIDIEQLYNSDFNRYKYVFDYLSQHIDIGDILKLPGSYYVRCIHKGPYNMAHTSFHKLLNYINLHHYTITGDAFLVPLVDLWATTSEDDYKSELLIPVEIE